MKDGMKVALECLLVILLVPQFFVLCYYFTYFVSAGNQVGLLKALSVYALTISWVSAPFLAALTALIRHFIGRRLRWYVTLLFCVVAGFAWLALWNRLVYDIFSYGRSAVPILLCSLGTAGYAMARKLYGEYLMPPRTAKKAESGLSE